MTPWCSPGRGTRPTRSSGRRSSRSTSGRSCGSWGQNDCVLWIADFGSCRLGVGRATRTAAQVAAALEIPVTHPGEYGRVSTDTRQIGAGDLFVALKGDRFDAHDFLADARAKGAAAAVVRRGTPRVDGLPVFEVADTLGALGLLARARRRALPPASPVVAITGSSGQTGTQEMIRAVLAVRYRVHATSGNLNNLVGVPLTILGAPDDTEALVVEAGGGGAGGNAPPLDRARAAL